MVLLFLRQELSYWNQEEEEEEVEDRLLDSIKACSLHYPIAVAAAAVATCSFAFFRLYGSSGCTKLEDS